MTDEAEVTMPVVDEPEHRDEAGEPCPECEGTGDNGGEPCKNCEATGKVPTGKAAAGGPTEANSADDPELEARARVRSMIEGTVERRDYKADMEVRETTDGGLRFSGYASVTETPYKVGHFTETFARGAFKRCLGEDPDVVLRIEHGDLPLARTRSGTLTLTEDNRGLKVDADLDPTDPDVQRLLPKLKREDLTEMSFAFKATDDEWSERDTKRVVRAATIHKGDVSVVTHGANPETSGNVAFRSDELGLEIRMDEGRAGKTHSKATEAEIDAAIEHLQKLRPQAEPKAEGESVSAEVLGVVIPHSNVDAERAERAKTISGGR